MFPDHHVADRGQPRDCDRSRHLVTRAGGRFCPSWPPEGKRLSRDGSFTTPPLIRRLSLDLLGLPPSPADVDAFVKDDRPQAYDQLVDRLLASPRFGERMAQFWLDLARYADSDGYHDDTNRAMWPYRDWVIDAFNQNKPFDEFTVEQLAGDLLPDATVATADRHRFPSERANHF